MFFDNPRIVFWSMMALLAILIAGRILGWW